MSGRQVPARAVSSDIEAVSHSQMPAEGSPAISAFQANDIILLYRAPDRHHRLWWLLHRYRAPKTCKGTMHLDDQCQQLVRGHLMMLHIAADDADDWIKIDLARRILFGHCDLPPLYLLSDILAWFVIIRSGIFINQDLSVLKSVSPGLRRGE